MANPLRIGTRGSPLALAQAQMVADALRASAGVETEIVPITTTGDVIQDRALAEVGGKALWTKELDRALLDGRTDLSVHSMKDVETLRPETLAIAAMLERADTRDRLIGAESLVVNQGVKRLFGRIRPTEAGDPRFPVRRPSTSSFPSGHASSAFFAAALLTTATGKRMAPVWYSTATVVALSRAYVRIHHPSDVVAGAAVGVVLGRIGSKIFKAIT